MNFNFDIYVDAGLGDSIDAPGAAPEPVVVDVTLSKTHACVVKGVYHTMELMQQRLPCQLRSVAEVKPLVEPMCIYVR